MQKVPVITRTNNRADTPRNARRSVIFCNIFHLMKDDGNPQGNGESGIVVGHVVPSRRDVRLHGVVEARVGHGLQEHG